MRILSYRRVNTCYLLVAIAFVCLFFDTANARKNGTPQAKVSVETLLKDMTSAEKQALYPDPIYSCRQQSSYDRASVSPHAPGWFANNDGFGIIRTDTIDGRIEKVLFDQAGPGAITRIWLTTLDKRGTMRFYFNGSQEPGWVIDSYDLMHCNVPGIGKGLLQAHTSYEAEGKGGNTLFLPIPYSHHCKVTFEDAEGVAPTPKYYQFNYLTYPDGTMVENFSTDVIQRAAPLIAAADSILLAHPSLPEKGVRSLKRSENLTSGKTLSIALPGGEKAIYRIRFHVEDIGQADTYGELMRRLIFTAEFDGVETVWVPLGDFSGGGMGAPEVKSWYLSSDGKGTIESYWLMPYKKEGKIGVTNLSDIKCEVSIELDVAPLKWDARRSLYFHTSWRQERGIYIHNRPEEADRCVEWNFADLNGRGIYKGDLLSLYNHAPLWYGEGDEKIWVDNDTFPSHFGTGTEDYYNSSWAPVVPFHTPFGGAPRADHDTSHGYNAFFRTRNLDAIPFNDHLRFDIEMLGWEPGTADYSTTVYWYGDLKATAAGISGPDEALLHLPSDNTPSK